MNYCFNEEDISLMLKELNLNSIDELLKDIPHEIRLKKDLNIPKARNCYEIEKYLDDIFDLNKTYKASKCFLGAGIYNHYVPAIVDELISREEFYTSYTPYQPEISQGNLTAIFEYQTFVSRLTKMDVSNASLYDGATSLAEAVLMALRVNPNKNEVLIAKTVHPSYIDVVKTYIYPLGIKVVDMPYDLETGSLDVKFLKNYNYQNVAAVIVSNPNFLGIIEDLELIRPIIPTSVIFIVSIHEALSLALLKPPGEFDVDIVCGDLQSFGNYMAFGGPTIGFLATKEKFLRQIPGRICGETVDKDNKRCFVFTLSTREQHIRREKANSNICTNQNLLAIRVAIYLSYMGEKKLREVALKSAQNAKYLYDKLKDLTFVTIPFSRVSFFNEFVIKLKGININKLIRELDKNSFLSGLPLNRFFKDLEDCILLATTELNTFEDIDEFVKVFQLVAP